MLDSLVRVTRRVGWVADIAADPLRQLYVSRIPALNDATRLGRTEDSPSRSTVTPGARGPRPLPEERKAQRDTASAAPGSGEVGAGGRCKARGRSRRPPSPPNPSKPTQSRSRRTAAEEMRPTGAGADSGGGRRLDDPHDTEPPYRNPPG